MDWNNFNNNYSDDDDRRQEEEFRKRNPEIEMENRAKNSWMMWVPFGIVFVVQFALSFIALEFLFTWDAVHFTGDSYMDFANGIMETVSGTTFNLIVSLAYAVICGVLFGIWYRRKFYLPARAAEGDRPRVSVWKKNPLLLAAGVVFLCVGAQYVCVYLMNALALLFPSWLMIYQQLMQGIGLDGGNVGILVALYSMILGPITEELTFRGLTLGYGRRAMPFWVANVVQAFLFAALHMNPLQCIYTFAFGLILGYVVYRSGSLVLGIVVHMAFNAIGVLFPQMIVMGNNPIIFFLFLLLGMVLTYAGLTLIGKCSPTAEERAGGNRG